MFAAVFPGQGSQQPGMGKFLFDNFTSAKRLFEEASDTIHVDFKKLCFEGSESDLALTHNTQPCLLLVSVASFQVLQDVAGFVPPMAAGHSIGEYAAVVTSGSLKFTDGIRAVRVRGEAMQSAVPVGVGGMTAVMGLESAQIIQLCQWAEKESGQSPVEPANFNAPGQIVISGRKSLLEWLSQHFTADIFTPESPRVKFIALKVSAPFHCSLMKPAEEKMATVLGEMQFSDGRFPIIQNVNAEAVVKGDDLRRNLVRQVSAPVRWIECVQAMQKSGATQFIEVGCGKVLSGLIKKISGAPTLGLNSMDDLKAIETALKGAH